MCFLAEEFGTSESITSGDECLINGIMKLHSVVALDDKVILLLWTHTNYTVSMIYHKCKGRKQFVKPSDFSLGNDDESILRGKIELQHTAGRGQKNVESVESDDDSSGDEDKEDDLSKFVV